MTQPGSPLDKRDWRRQQRTRLLELRARLGAEERALAQQKILHSLLELLDGITPDLLAIYWPIKGELDMRPLAAELAAGGWRFALPVINNETMRLDFCDWSPGMEMIPGDWNIPTPARRKVVHPSLFLVPLVGFDRQGYRLGYGGGYYDRTLAALAQPVTAIGVGLEQGRFETIFPHAHDVPMQLIVTEQGVQKG